MNWLPRATRLTKSKNSYSQHETAANRAYPNVTRKKYAIRVGFSILAYAILKADLIGSLEAIQYENRIHTYQHSRTKHR